MQIVSLLSILLCLLASLYPAGSRLQRLSLCRRHSSKPAPCHQMDFDIRLGFRCWWASRVLGFPAPNDVEFLVSMRSLVRQCPPHIDKSNLVLRIVSHSARNPTSSCRTHAKTPSSRTCSSPFPQAPLPPASDQIPPPSSSPPRHRIRGKKKLLPQSPPCSYSNGDETMHN